MWDSGVEGEKVKENDAGVIQRYSWIKEQFLFHLHEENR